MTLEQAESLWRKSCSTPRGNSELLREIKQAARQFRMRILILRPDRAVGDAVRGLAFSCARRCCRGRRDRHISPPLAWLSLVVFLECIGGRSANPCDSLDHVA